MILVSVDRDYKSCMAKCLTPCLSDPCSCTDYCPQWWVTLRKFVSRSVIRFSVFCQVWPDRETLAILQAHSLTGGYLAFIQQTMGEIRR
jgi:hypothetical protein